jgi:hypothetical protein
MDGPQFLVIGGMKCGSTSLYDDLRRQPAICLAEKELNLLSDPKFSAHRARTVYAREFAAAAPHQKRGDVSTTYSKLPEFPKVAARAYELCGPDLKIVYVVREPVARCISHHYHMHAWRAAGHMPADIDFCVREYSSIIDYSRYAMQLEPWRDHFGDNAIRVVLFEEFIRDRLSTMSQLGSFLNFQVSEESIQPTSISNQSDNKPVLNSFWRRIHENQFYQATLRRVLPADLRHELRKLILPKAPARPAGPSIETVDMILDRTRDDELELRRLMGRTAPLWDFAEVKTKYADPAAASI